MRTIDNEDLRRLSAKAAALPRRRANWNLHPTLDDPVQRLCNAMEPGTYVRPHRHTELGRWECFLALVGAAAVVTFDANRVLRHRVVIAAAGPVRGVEIPDGTWHTVASLERGTALFEIKPGPYSVVSDKDFAPWAPPEGDPLCPVFERWFREGIPGSTLDPRGAIWGTSPISPSPISRGG